MVATAVDPAIQAGRVEASTLAEILALDHAVLLDAVLPAAPEPLRAAVRQAGGLGILARMQAIGAALHHHLVTVGHQFVHPHGRDRHAELVVLHLGGNCDPHAALLRICADRCTHTNAAVR